MNDLWRSILSEIELEVSKPNFLTFFKNTKLVSHEDSVATISCSTQIAAEYVEKRYYSLIKKVVDKKTGQNNSLIFVSGAFFPAGEGGGMKRVSSGPLFAQSETTKRTAQKVRGLRKDYTFDEFAVSESNQLGYTACLTVAQGPGSRYNPLFLYGTVGVGKTHLMHAVAHSILDKNSDARVLYLTSEEFTNEVVEAIRDKATTQLRKKFRTADLLLLDDIQFVGGKERVQEELFHTFNALIDKGKQIIFTSDKPPSEIKKLEARLASRFESGLTVDIQSPDFELRSAILLKKAKKYNFLLENNVAQLIAEKITDTRALEGFLLRLLSETSIRKVPVSNELAHKLLGDKKREDAGVLRPDNVVSFVCSHFGVRPTQLKGSRREAFLVRPRQVCMYLLKEEVGLSFVEVGNLLGGRDHTTIMYGVDKIKSLQDSSPKFREEILLIKKGLTEDFLS